MGRRGLPEMHQCDLRIRGLHVPGARGLACHVDRLENGSIPLVGSAGGGGGGGDWSATTLPFLWDPFFASRAKWTEYRRGISAPSSTTTLDPPINAMASPSFLFMPPESCDESTCRFSRSPTAAMMASTACTVFSDGTDLNMQ